MHQIHNKLQRTAGFTLLEILIALFIFTLLSMMMAGGLHTVINAQSGTEENAERLRKLQIAMLIMTRDVEQTINRPITNTIGKEDAAFIGTPRGFTFTHAGLANPVGTLQRSTLQRTAYTWADNAIWRATWTALDQAPQSQPHKRILLGNVTEARFEYLDKDKHFHESWPLEGQSNQPLPRAVRVVLTISQWGSISQLYVISAQQTKAAMLPPASPPSKKP